MCPFLLGPALASKVVWWLLFFFLVQISSTFRQTSHIQIDGGEERFESEKGLDPIYLSKWKKCCSRFAIKLRPWEEGPLLKSFFFFFWLPVSELRLVVSHLVLPLVLVFLSAQRHLRAGVGIIRIGC